jgi:transcriptional regulator with XRE-family HTH domain
MTKPVDEQQEEVMRRLAGTIRLLREREKLSLREFAEKSGVSHSDIFRLENGSSRNASIFLINRIAQAFDLTVDELMNFHVETCPTCMGSGWIKKGEREQ